MEAYEEVIKKPWRKILYEKQEYPDNYLDEDQFKKDLKKNLNIKTQSVSKVISDSSVIVQEINCVFLFVSIFWHLENASLSPLVTLIVLLLLSSLLLLTIILSFSISFAQVLEWLKQSSLFLLFLCGVSPILKTLTESISSDSLWLMIVTMLLIHLLFHNYGNDGVLVSETFSLNAAIFAAVCLASRLQTSLHAFVTVCLAVFLFALLPKLRNNALVLEKIFRQQINVGLSVLVLISLALLFRVELLVIFVSCHLIFLASVVLFVKLQFVKNTIHGPWDEAVIDLHKL